MAYTKIKNFKFWCQKVLPLVYDDSLSYYEVLCKIRDYINDIIADMDELSQMIEDLDSRVDALEDELENISQSIIEEIKEYLGTEEFISHLVEALEESQTFNNWFKDFITNNEDVIRDLINSEYFDEYFSDYFTNNTDLINQLLSSAAFSQYFQNAFDETTDFYDISTVAGDSIQSGGLISNYYAIGKNSEITSGTRLKVMYAPTLTPIVGKFERTESGGFYNYASDGDTNYTSFIIDMNGYSGRNLYFYIAESFEPFSLILVKRGSLDTGGVSITSDKASATMQVAYVPATWTSNYVETTKKVNYAIVSIKNNGVSFNPIFAYSIRNVDYDGNTDYPILIPYNTYAIWNGASDTAVTSLELYNPKNDLAYIIFGMLGSTQYGLNEEVNVVDSNLSNMQEDITELKNSVSDGKAQVASAITDKGVATASNATFNTMATNIRNIQTERTYPNGFFKRDSLTDVTNSLLTILPSQYAFTNIDMTRSWRIYDDLLNNGFNVHSLTTTTETVDDTTVTYRTFKLSPPGDNNIGYIFSYTDSTLTSVNRYTVNLGSFSSIFSASTSRFLIKKIKNSYCIIRFIDGVTPTDYTNYVHFLSNAYDSNAVLFGCLFEQALLTSNSFDFSLEGGTNNGTTSNKGQSQTANANDLFIQDLYSSGINTSTLVTPFYVDSLYFATVFPTSAIHTESYIFKSDDEYEFLLLPVNGVNSNYRPIRIK